MAVPDQFMHPSRRNRDAILVDLYFARDPDLHRYRPFSTSSTGEVARCGDATLVGPHPARAVAMPVTPLPLACERDVPAFPDHACSMPAAHQLGEDASDWSSQFRRTATGAAPT